VNDREPKSGQREKREKETITLKTDKKKNYQNEPRNKTQTPNMELTHKRRKVY